MSDETAWAMVVLAASVGEEAVKTFARLVLEERAKGPQTSERERELSRARSQRYRDERRRAVRGSEDAAEWCGKRDASRENSVTERDDSEPLPRARARSQDLRSPSLSLEIPGDTTLLERGDASVTRHGNKRDERDALRGSRVPPSDAPIEEIEAFCRRWKIPTMHPEWSRFIDHWRAQPGAKGRKADWAATWRNWVRRAPELAPSKPNGVRSPSMPSQSAQALPERVASFLGKGRT